ncbi:MAG: response regulator [Dehalococcoidales bacterium]|nr:response regulator [Dehalococcoidales bacterium]
MMNPLVNPSYLLPPLIVFITALVLLGVILNKAKKSFARTIFCLLLASVSMGGFLIFGMRSSANVYQALPWDRASFGTTYAIFAFFYHFTLSYTNNKGNRGILYFAYAMLVLAAILGPSNLIVERMTLEYYGYAPVSGPVALVLAIIIVFLSVQGIINLAKYHKAFLSAEERNRSLYLIIATIILIVGALIDGFSPLPPVAIWSGLTFCIICTVAIVKYHLLDIRLVIRKGVYYLLVSFMVAVPYVTVVFVLTQVLHTRFEHWWQYVLIIIPMAVALHPLYVRGQQWADRVFYRGRYDYLKELEQFSRKCQDITNFRELSGTFVKLINGALHLRNTSLLLAAEDGGGLVIASSVGLDNPQSGTIVRGRSILVRWFQSHDETISARDFDVVPELQSIARAEKHNLARLKPELYVPIKGRRGELTGLLVLGEKLSQQPYFLDDNLLLSTVSRQVSVGLENSRLYRDALIARKNLETWLNGMDDCVIIKSMDNIVEFANMAAVKNLGAGIIESFPAVIGKGAEPSNSVTRPDNYADESVSRYAINVGDREFDVVAAPLSNNDGTVSTIGVFRDVTERRRAELEKKELERKAQLSDRLASIGEMASGIAHEINNPLTGVIGFSELMMTKDIPGDIRKDLEVIHDGSKRVAGIVKGLLTFARQRKPERTYTDINQIVADTLALRSYALETSNIMVDAVLDPDLPRTMADAGQLQQVFMNIIVNGEAEMKKAHGKGNFTVKTERIADIIRISFRDDGPGIARENMDKIFDPFFTTKPVGEGTGLGLSLCHGIIAEHQGRIYAESEPVKGATFVVELPVVVEEREEADTPTGEPVKVAGARILIVDDEPTILEFLSRLLASEGHQVETVDNSSDALEMIKGRRYSIILLDVKLPDMGGIELYQRIKEIAPSLTRRVVIITGDVAGAGTSKFLKENKIPYITKPFDIKLLKQELNRILSGGRHARKD